MTDIERALREIEKAEKDGDKLVAVTIPWSDDPYTIIDAYKRSPHTLYKLAGGAGHIIVVEFVK